MAFLFLQKKKTFYYINKIKNFMSYIKNTLIPFLDMCSCEFIIPQSISLQENQPINKELLKNFKLLIYKNKKLFTQFSLYSVNFEKELISTNELNVKGYLNAGVGVGNNQTLSIRMAVSLDIENNLFIVGIDKENSIFSVGGDSRNLNKIPFKMQTNCEIIWS